MLDFIACCHLRATLLWLTFMNNDIFVTLLHSCAVAFMQIAVLISAFVFQHGSLIFQWRSNPCSFNGAFPICKTLKPCFSMMVQPLFLRVCFLFVKHWSLIFQRRSNPFSFRGMSAICEIPKPHFSSKVKPFFVLRLCYLFVKHRNLVFQWRSSPFSFKGVFPVCETPKPCFSMKAKHLFF
jgi:hypothetical protein